MSWIVVGVLIAFVGTLVPIAQFAFFLIPNASLNGMSVFIVFGSVYTTSQILWGLGGFLILEGFARGRPDSAPFTSVAGLVVLLTSIASGLANLAFFLSLESTGPRDLWLNLLSIGRFVLGVAGGGAFLLGLYGIGRAVLRTPPTGLSGFSP